MAKYFISGKTANGDYTEELTNILENKKIFHKKCKGKYNGITEDSFLITASESLAIALGKLFEQESILELKNNLGTLIYMENEKRVYLGAFTEINKTRANKENAYTYMDGNYYILE